MRRCSICWIRCNRSVDIPTSSGLPVGSEPAVSVSAIRPSARDRRTSFIWRCPLASATSYVSLCGESMALTLLFFLGRDRNPQIGFLHQDVTASRQVVDLPVHHLVKRSANVVGLTDVSRSLQSAFGIGLLL